MLDAVDISTSQTSAATNITHLDRASIIVEWTGATPIGTLTVEARKKETQAQTADTSWITLDFGQTIDIVNNAGDHLLILDSLDFTDIRVVYTSVGGAGSLTATLTAKQVGG